MILNTLAIHSKYSLTLKTLLETLKSHSRDLMPSKTLWTYFKSLIKSVCLSKKDIMPKCYIINFVKELKGRSDINLIGLSSHNSVWTDPS
jgi:hypothetical protein